MKRRYETSDACIPAQTPRRYRMPLRKATTLQDDEQTHAYADRFGALGRIYIGFLGLITAFFVKLLILLWMQQDSIIAATGSVDASQDYVFFWLVMTICVFPVLGICVLLFWMATGFKEHQALSRIEHNILARGTLAVGKVISIDGPIVSLEYQNKEGHSFRAPVELQDLSLRKDWTPGRETTVLVDPKDPRRFLAPSLMGIQFQSLAQIVDNRPQVLLGALRASHLDPLPNRDCAIRLKDPLPLTQTHKPLRKRLSDLVTLRFLRGRVRRSIVLDGASLMLFEGDRDEPIKIDLHQPFRVETSTWLLPRNQAIVRVAVRAACSSLERASIEFGLILDQSQVSAKIPLLQASAPLLSQRELAPIWDVLCFHAAVHGEPLGELIELVLQPKKRDQNAATEESSETVVATARRSA